METLDFNYTDYGVICEYSKEYLTTGEQPLIFIPGNVDQMFLTFTPIEGTGKLQTTTDTYEDIKAGNIVWVDHPQGVVGTILQDSCGGVSAIRVVVVTGTAKLSIRAIN